MIELRVHGRIEEIGRDAWDRLAAPAKAPFLRFAWLDALERTGCVSPERGWLPQHLAFHEDGELVAVAPAYLKGNSEGEFVFDHSWAHLAERLGIEYFPKLILAVPFTPATSPRLLVAAPSLRSRLVPALGEALGRLVELHDISSAHVLFPTAEEATLLSQAGLFERHGVQFQWTNQGYSSFDDFLRTFDSKRRNQIRRERREARKGLSFEICYGDDITEEVVEAMYRFYLATVDKFLWGRRYLNREFFFEVCSTMRDAIQIVIVRDGQNRIVAGAFNLFGGDVLYGRYWGCDEPIPFLHFEVCYYLGIEACIERKLQRFEPGAGGEHKRARGFLPTVTYSSHLLREPRFRAIVAAHVARERKHIADMIAEDRSR